MYLINSSYKLLVFTLALMVRYDAYTDNMANEIPSAYNSDIIYKSNGSSISGLRSIQLRVPSILFLSKHTPKLCHSFFSLVLSGLFRLILLSFLLLVLTLSFCSSLSLWCWLRGQQAFTGAGFYFSLLTESSRKNSEPRRKTAEIPKTTSKAHHLWYK